MADRSAEKLRWGILGTARTAAKRMLPAMLRAAHEIVAIAGRNDQRLAEFKDRFGIGSTYQWDRAENILADQNIVAVYIPLPNSLHAQWVVRALAAGKHVLCEKPIAFSLNDVEEIANAAARSGRVVQENFSYNLTPGYRYLEELQHTESLSALESITIRYSFRATREHEVRYDRTLGGGCFLDLGCYGVDFVHRLLNAPIKVVQVRRCSPPVEQHSWGSGAAQPVDVECRFTGTAASNVTVSILTSFIADLQQSVQLTMIGGTSFLLPQAFRVEGVSSAVIRSMPDGVVDRKTFAVFDTDLEMVTSFAKEISDGVSIQDRIRRWRSNAAVLETVLKFPLEQGDH
jgi:predicted dehydrogenase